MYINPVYRYIHVCIRYIYNIHTVYIYIYTHTDVCLQYTLCGQCSLCTFYVYTSTTLVNPYQPSPFLDFELRAFRRTRSAGLPNAHGLPLYAEAVRPTCEWWWGSQWFMVVDMG